MCSELHDMFDDTGSFAKTITIRKALFAFNAAKASMKNAVGKQKPKTENQKINSKKKYFIF